MLVADLVADLVRESPELRVYCRGLINRFAERDWSDLSDAERASIPSAIRDDLQSRSENACSLADLAIVTCHFNPAGYLLPRRNYWEWRHSLGALGDRLTTVELTFPGQRPTIPDAIPLRTSSVLWQKEALLNIAIDSLPPSVKYVAWIDHDLIFERSDWAEELVRRLSGGCDVLQLFDRIVDLDADRRVSRVMAGQVAAKLCPSLAARWTAAGAAWGARRDYLHRIGGLNPWNIVGGGDQAMCDGWLENRLSYYRERCSADLFSVNQEWGERARAELVGEVGFLRGTVRHLYHGTRANRHYEPRTRWLIEYGYDPRRDVMYDESGLVQWTGKNPDLEAAVGSYFSLRKEDQ